MYANWEEFKKAFKAHFETADDVVDAKEPLKNLWQGRNTVAQYINGYPNLTFALNIVLENTTPRLKLSIECLKLRLQMQKKKRKRMFYRMRILYMKIT